MIDQSIVGLTLEQTWKYDYRDTILYALAVGANANESPDELKYVWEGKLQAIPAFSSLVMGATFGADPNTGGLYMPTGLIKDWPEQGLLHMEHSVEFHKPLNPLVGYVHSKKTITDVYDRGEGKGIQIAIRIDSTDEDGTPLFTNYVSVFNGLCPSFGGPRPPKSKVVIPDRDPDYRIEGSTDTKCNEVFRLTGDTFELHIDPDFAHKAGFPRPITHGLCSYGYANRVLVNRYLPDDVNSMKTFGCQFRSVAFPGDRYTVQAWENGDSSLAFQMINPDTGAIILDKGFMTW